MDFDNEIVLRFPAPSDGIETVLVMVAIGALLVAVLAALQHRDKVARMWKRLKAHPWEKASPPVNLLSWGALICVGSVAAILFGMAVGEAYALLQQKGGPESGVGSLGRGAVIVALIGAPFVIWRSVVAQKTVNVTEQGHITDRINTAVQGLGAQKEVNQIGRPVFLREVDPDHAAKESTDSEEKYTDIEWKGEALQIPIGMYVAEEEEWQVFTQTQPNLEVRIGAIYALERIAQDSDRDHVQIMEILCAYIRQNAPAPEGDDWPELEMKEGEEDGPLEADWDQRLKTFREAQEEATAKLRVREDLQTALTVIGRRSAKQRRLEAGRGVETPFPFDTAGPDHDPTALDGYRQDLVKSNVLLRDYAGYRLDLRNADLRGADLSGAELNGARLNGTYLQGADLAQARLQGAVLEEARLQGAILVEARLHRTNLASARLQGADLREARLQGAFLGEARFDPRTILTAATLHGAAVRIVDFTDFPEIAGHVQGMFGDASVTLPGGHGPEHESWPLHWPKCDLDLFEFYQQWREWQANPKTYRPPDPPGPDDPA